MQASQIRHDIKAWKAQVRVSFLVAVEATRTSAVWVLERASDGAQAGVRLVGRGLERIGLGGPVQVIR